MSYPTRAGQGHANLAYHCPLLSLYGDIVYRLDWPMISVTDVQVAILSYAKPRRCQHGVNLASTCGGLAHCPRNIHSPRQTGELNLS